MPEITMFKQAEVERGAKFLDEKVPGWFERIDLDKLDMSEWDRCIIGQLEGDFLPGLEKLGLARDKASSHGFILNVYSVDDYLALDETWHHIIQERRGVRPFLEI